MALLLFSYPAFLHSTSYGPVRTKGTSQTPRHKCQFATTLFFLKHNARVQYFTQYYSGAVQSATPSLQISPSSCCKPFQGVLYHGYFKYLKQGFCIQVSGLGLHLEPGSYWGCWRRKSRRQHQCRRDEHSLSKKSFVMREIPFKSCIQINLRQKVIF